MSHLNVSAINDVATTFSRFSNTSIPVSMEEDVVVVLAMTRHDDPIFLILGAKTNVFFELKDDNADNNSNRDLGANLLFQALESLDQFYSRLILVLVATRTLRVCVCQSKLWFEWQIRFRQGFTILLFCYKSKWLNYQIYNNFFLFEPFDKGIENESYLAWFTPEWVTLWVIKTLSHGYTLQLTIHYTYFLKVKSIQLLLIKGLLNEKRYFSRFSSKPRLFLRRNWSWRHLFRAKVSIWRDHFVRKGLLPTPIIAYDFCVVCLLNSIYNQYISKCYDLQKVFGHGKWQFSFEVMSTCKPDNSCNILHAEGVIKL